MPPHDIRTRREASALVWPEGKREWAISAADAMMSRPAPSPSLSIVAKHVLMDSMLQCTKRNASLGGRVGHADPISAVRRRAASPAWVAWRRRR